MDISNYWFAGVAILAVLAGCSRDDATTPAPPSAALAAAAEKLASTRITLVKKSLLGDSEISFQCAG